MKQFLLVFAIAFLLSRAFAQSQNFVNKTVIIQRGDSIVQQFNDFTQEVIDAAQDGDKIYLSAGTFTGDVSIDKKLSVFGTGYFDNSFSSIPRKTFILGQVYFINSSGIFFSGIHSNHTLLHSNVNNVTIERCRIYDLRLAHQGNVTDNIIKNNYIHNLWGCYGGCASNVTIFNNIIERAFSFTSGLFDHNIFIGNNNYYLLHEIEGCYFQNNVFLSACNGFMNNENVLNNSFSNNIFAGFSPDTLNNIFENNLFNVNIDSIFNSISYEYCNGNPYIPFEFTHNFHLQENSIGIGNGNDGTDIGIYGGWHPWKDGALPANPRVSQFNISPINPENGLIQINATVEGQSR